jgi:clan AA aspartic protease (TIGR02281 family)
MALSEGRQDDTVLMLLTDKSLAGRKVHLEIDGQGWSANTQARSYTAGIEFTHSDSDTAFLHALYNGTWLTIDGHQFSLTGSATAITMLHRCGAALRSGRSLAPTTTATAATGRNEIALMQSRGGGYDINASINGSAPIRFEVDTGASNVVIPRDLAERLGREGRLTQGDFLGNGRATLADGSKIPTEHFNLRTLQIGSIVLHNVECTVGNVGSSLLLGMSVFSKFPSWSIDNRRGVLVVGG